MIRHRRKGSSRDTVSLAGWLFADLLLGLAMFFLVANAISPQPVRLPTYTQNPTFTPFPTFTPLPTFTAFPTFTPLPSFTPQPTYTALPTYTPVPSPTGTLGPPGINPISQCYNIAVNPSRLLGSGSQYQAERTAILTQLNRQISNQPSFRAGTVLIWGHGNTIEQGRQISERIKQILRNDFSTGFRDAGMKSLFFSVGDVGNVQIEIYFFSDSTGPSRSEVSCSIKG